MALGGKSKKKSKVSSGKGKGNKKDARYQTLMQILEGDREDDNGNTKPYAKANNYKGRLIWQAFGGDDGDDEDASTFFEIKTAFIGTPHESAPDFVLQTIVVNLNNPKAAEAIDG